jgi:hypothetical protein
MTALLPGLYLALLAFFLDRALAAARTASKEARRGAVSV